MQVLHQSPTDRDFVQDPYPVYASARDRAELIWWTDYDHPVALSHALVSTLFRDPRFGREHPSGPPRGWPDHLAPFYALETHSMLEREAPTHTRLRRLVNRAFTSRAIAGTDEHIVSLAHRLIDDFEPGGTELLSAWAERIPVIIIARLLGVPETMADQLLAWSHAIVGMYQARRNREMEDAAARAATDFAEFMAAHIEARRKTPGNRLLDALIAAEAEGDRLSMPELISTSILILNAGHEATVHALGNGVRALLLHTDTPRRYLVPDTIDRTVEEILRFDPPLHMFTRFAREDADIAGHTFQAGDVVGLGLGAANRDPEMWDNPHQFLPDRAPRQHTSFGGGIHFCVGAPLARRELALALPVLFERCPKLTLTLEPRYADRYHFHGLEALNVAF